LSGKAGDRRIKHRVVNAILIHRRKSLRRAVHLARHFIPSFGLNASSIAVSRDSNCRKREALICDNPRVASVRFSFDVQGSIRKAQRLVKLYEEQGIGRERVLIKIASTWEGIMAAEQLQREGIKCNMTLLFSLPQAVRAAEAKVQLISPFVGRIYDWFKAAKKRDYSGAEDPGVQSVQEIYTYYKHFDYETEVMGASFRNTGQILELAGCDLLTISPELMKQLFESYEPVERKLTPERARSADVKRLELDEKKFRYLLNEDAMATEKTAEGIRKFAADIAKLEKFIASKIN